MSNINNRQDQIEDESCRWETNDLIGQPVALVGFGERDNYIADMFMLAGVGMGLTKYVILDSGLDDLSGLENSFLKKIDTDILPLFQRVRSETSIQFYSEDRAKQENPRVIVDCTNDVYSKFKWAGFCQDNEIPFVSLSSSYGECYYFRGTSKLEDNCKNIELIGFYDSDCQESVPQDPFSSMVAVGWGLESVKKVLMPWGHEYSEDNSLRYSRRSRIRIDGKMDSELDLENLYKDLNTLEIAIIGMGAIGQPLALGMALVGAKNITLVDGDKVLTHNLNRQPLCYDARYGEHGDYKVDTVAGKLKKINPNMNVKVIKDFILEGNRTEFFESKPDVIFSAVDGFTSRNHINNYSIEQDTPIPIVNAGSSWNSGDFNIFSGYAPSCLSCQLGLSYLEFEEDKVLRERLMTMDECGQGDPSLVIPNLMIAGMEGMELPSFTNPTDGALFRSKLRYNWVHSAFSVIGNITRACRHVREKIDPIAPKNKESNKRVELVDYLTFIDDSK